MEGKFRTAAHGLLEDLKEHEIDTLQVALLMVRRYEKDFISTGSDKYKQKLIAAISSYKELLDKSSCEKNSKKTQQQALSSYEDGFKRYLEADYSSSLQDQSYQTMRTAAHEMEEAIGQVTRV